MSMRGPSNYPPRGGPRFNNFPGPGQGPVGFMPGMGPNQGSPGMMGPPPMFPGPGQQFEAPFIPSNQSQMGPTPHLGQPREMSPMQRMGGSQGFMGGPPGMPPGLPQLDPTKDVWVETGTDQGKVYYYHAKTRKSVWKKPTEENVQIITQNEANALAAAAAAGIFPGFGAGGPSGGDDQSSGQQNMQQGQNQDGGEWMNNDSSTSGTGSHSNEQPSRNFEGQDNMEHQPSGDNQNVDDTSESASKENDCSAEQAGPRDNNQQQNTQNSPMVGPMRPNLGGPNHMPLMGGPTAMPLMGPPASMMPPAGLQMPGMPGFPGMPFGGHMAHPLMGGPMMPPGATVWRAHKAPDGRPYYYNVTTMETQWNKPRELEQMEEAAKKAAAEKEAQKLEAERRMVLGQTATTNEKHGDPTKQVRMDTSSVSGGVAMTSGVLTEEDKAKQKERPVATEPVPGTPWCVVWTGDEKVFFYNPTTRLSMWTRPEELTGRSDIDKILGDPPHKRKRPAEPEPTPAVAVEAEEITEDAAQVPAKKKKKKKSIDSTTTDKPVPIAPYVPLEGRINQFKEMLHERQVSAFSTWDKELHKIVFDPRYTMLNSKERRQVFDDYVKSRAEEERKEKKAHLLKVKEEFKKLLEESKITSRTSFSEFAGKHGKEPRFKAVERMKEREALFNEYIKESKQKKTEEAKNKSLKIKSDYMALLEEKRTQKYSRWSRVKEKISSDSRYSAVESSIQREDMWNEYCDQRKKDSKSDDDEESEKKRRTEESMKARLEQVEREKAERSREIDSERQKHRVDEAIQHFKALLADMVRSTDQSWSDTRRQLRKEPRWGMASLISKEEKEKYFDEHIEALNKRKRSAFRQLLEENSDIAFTSSWKEVKKIVKEDPRYTKFSTSDRKREREFDEVMKDKRSQAKAEFRNLLKETKAITHKTKEQSKSNPQLMKEIISILENDKRYLILDSMPRDREDMIYLHIDELHRKGPPPPPTATEPSRRAPK